MKSFLPLFILNIFALGVFVIPSTHAVLSISCKLLILAILLLGIFVFPADHNPTPNLAAFTMLDTYQITSSVGLLVPFVDAVIGALHGEDFRMQELLFLVSLASYIVIPARVARLYVNYRHRLKEMEQAKSKEYENGEYDILAKSTRSSSDKFPIWDWGRPDFIAQEEENKKEAPKQKFQ